MRSRSASVVIPTRERSELAAQCLAHLAADPLAAELQVVVADDSEDASLRIDPPAGLGEVLLVRSHGRGRGAARNCGWRASSAPIVVFLDDDIRPARSTLDKITRAVTTGEGDWVQATTVPGRNGTPAGDLLRSVRGSSAAPDNARSRDRPFFATGCLATRRDCLEELDGFDEELPRLVDWEMSLRARRNGHRIRCLPDALAEDLDPLATTTAEIVRRVETSNRYATRLTACFPELLVGQDTGTAACAVPLHRMRDFKSALRRIAEYVFSLPVLYPLLLRSAILAERRNWRHYPLLGKLLFCAAEYRGFRLGLKDLVPTERLALRAWSESLYET